MTVRLLIQDQLVYEGDAVPIPRSGDVIDHGGQSVPVEAVTWQFSGTGDVDVTLVVGDRPYTY
jgi:hypothetical protein